MKFKWILIIGFIIILIGCEDDKPTSGGFTLTISSLPDTLYTLTTPNSSEVTAMLINDNHPVAGEEITFTTNNGEITGSAVTNNNGIATVVFNAYNAQPGTSTIIASYQEIEVSTKITIIGSTADLTVLSSTQSIMVGSGENTCQITAIYTENGLPVQNVQVFFSTDLGEITTFGVTDEDGIATAIFENSNYEIGIANIGVNCNGLEQGTYIILSLDPYLEMDVSTTADTLYLGSDINNCQIIAEFMRNGNPVVGLPVGFSSDIGSISDSAVTDENGIAESTFFYNDDLPAIATCEVTFATMHDEISISIVDEAIDDLEVWADPNMIILGSGNYNTNVFARLTDHDGNPISDAIIDFEVSSGIISSSSITDINGEIELDYMFTGDEEEIIQLTATYQEQSEITYIYVVEPELVLTAWADPDTIYQGTSANYSDIYAQLTTENGSPITDMQINFTTTTGSILSYGITNNQGVASTTFWYSERPDITAVITASYQGLTANTSVTILEDQLEIVFLEADPLIIYADNDPETYSVIRARVVDSAGTPIEDAVVTFQTNLGYMALDSAQTNFNGYATNRLHDNGETGIATIYLTCDNDHSQIDVQIVED